MFGSLFVLRRGVSIALSAIVLILGLAAVTSWRSTAGADPYPPSSGCTLSTSHGSLRPGHTVTLTGSGFAPNSPVHLVSGSTSLGDVTTDDHGSFAKRVTLPPSSDGTVEIDASSANEDCGIGAGSAGGHSGGGGTHGGQGTGGSTQHRSGGSGTTGTAPQTQSTAYTGFAAITASSVAAALLLGGLLLVILGRRRSQS